MSFPWENYLAVIELLSLVCSSDLPRGTLSTCLSNTHILGSGHVMLYPLDIVPSWSKISISQAIMFQRDLYDNCVDNDGVVSCD